MKNHTKGPWYVDGGCITSDAINQWDCIVEHVYGPEGNYDLIAAAPEMYEALRDLVAACEKLGVTGGNLSAAHEALAKAEGKV